MRSWNPPASKNLRYRLKILVNICNRSAPQQPNLLSRDHSFLPEFAPAPQPRSQSSQGSSFLCGTSVLSFSIVEDNHASKTRKITFWAVQNLIQHWTFNPIQHWTYRTYSLTLHNYWSWYKSIRSNGSSLQLWIPSKLQWQKEKQHKLRWRGM